MLLEEFLHCYELYTSNPDVYRNSGLRYKIYQDCKLIEQNPDKPSVFGKLAAAGLPVTQVFYRDKYVGVLLGKEFYFYLQPLYELGSDAGTFQQFLMQAGKRDEVKAVQSDLKGIKITKYMNSEGCIAAVIGGKVLLSGYYTVLLFGSNVVDNVIQDYTEGVATF